MDNPRENKEEKSLILPPSEANSPKKSKPSETQIPSSIPPPQTRNNEPSQRSGIPNIPSAGDGTQHTKVNEEEEKSTLKKVDDQLLSGGSSMNQQKFSKSDFKIQNISPLRRDVRGFVRSKPVVYLIVFLVIIYTILIFVDITLNQLLTEDELDSFDKPLRYVELVILTIFQVEIILNAFGTGVKNYFRDTWLLLDEVVILLSLALVILDLTLSFGSQFQSVASIIRAIFRFLRIFLLLRKLQNFKKIKVSSTIKTPSEKVLEVLLELKDYFDNTETIADIDWTMKMIASNKLYEPVLNETGGDKTAGDLVAAWSNQNQGQQNKQAGTQGQNPNINEPKLISQNQKKTATLRQVSQLPDQQIARFIPSAVRQEFEKIDELTFDCFQLKEVSKGQEVSYLLAYLFDKYELLKDLKIDQGKFLALAVQIQNGYRDNLYHDRLHSFDVTQSVNFLLVKCKFQEISKISQLERAAMYFSASIHDFDHPGVNNTFMINTAHQLAIKYNDQSVLENHHVSSVFEMVLKTDSLNIFANFSNEDYKNFREMSINMILSTDMTKHFTDISKLKSRISASDFEIDGKDKKIVMESILHASDISNPLRPWKVCFEWTNRVMAEFWAQGDQEKQLGLPITYLCDRYETNTSKSQQGFIDFIVKPLFEILSNVLPELSPYLQNFEHNKEKWAELFPKYEAELKKLKEDNEKGGETQI